MLKPGDPGTPVPGGTHVFRLARADSSSGESSYTAFELSEADRRQNPPRLSVWLSELTLPHQARSLLQNAEQYQFALHLATDTIRSLHSLLPTNGARLHRWTWCGILCRLHRPATAPLLPG